MTRRLVSGWPLAVVGMAGLYACAPHYLQVQSTPNIERYPITTIAVLPFVSGLTDRGDSRYRTGQIAQGAEETLTGLLYTALEQLTGFQLVPRELVERELGARAAPPESPPELQQLAQRLKADAVMRCVVTEYRERVGNYLGATRPAAVGVELWLISQRDGRVIWQGRYYEEQQTMTGEVRTLPLYVTRGTKWLTAQELAHYAIDKLVNALPRATPGPPPPPSLNEPGVGLPPTPVGPNTDEKG